MPGDPFRGSDHFLFYPCCGRSPPLILSLERNLFPAPFFTAYPVTIGSFEDCVSPDLHGLSEKFRDIFRYFLKKNTGFGQSFLGEQSGLRNDPPQGAAGPLEALLVFADEPVRRTGSGHDERPFLSSPAKIPKLLVPYCRFIPLRGMTPVPVRPVPYGHPCST